MKANTAFSKPLTPLSTTTGEAVKQIMAWGEAVKFGGTRVEGDDLRAHLTALLSLRRELTQSGIRSTQVALPQMDSPVTGLCELLDSLEGHEPGLILIKGFPEIWLTQETQLLEPLGNRKSPSRVR
jgi:hypothetical protein